MKKLILLLALSIVAFQPRAFAQADRATIAGQAVDSSGSAVVGAEVRIVNVDTNLTLDTVVNETGNYRFVAVPVGMYTLTATAPGFQTYERQNIQANGNQTTIVEIAFQVGAVSETVTVVAGAVPLISPESSEVGVVVESKKFLNLPLTLGGGIRNPSSFIKLAPGVASTSTWNKSINGGRQFDDETYFDGIALSRGDLSNDGEVNPSVDAIAEFKLISNNYSAEYSHAVGGITSFTLKSGTNQIHGTAFHFFRNDKLDARSFFSADKSPVRQNEWGGTIGGPMVKNRTFWFFSFDQFYRRGGQVSGLNTLPTAQMQQGDFGELVTEANRPIYDPATTTVGANGATRNPFPNAVIPESRWSRVTSVMLPYHPKPSLPGIAQNDIAPLSSNFQDHRTLGFKLDHRINDKHRISGMFNATDRPAQKSPGPSRLIPVGDTTALANYNIQRVTTRIIHANIDSTLSPTTLNNIRIGYSRFRNPNFSESFNQGWLGPDGGKLGLTGLPFDLFPTIQFDTEGYTRYGDNIASDNFFNTATLGDTATLIRGSHTIKIGAEWQYHQDNFRNFGNGGGDFRFRRNGTGNPQAFDTTGDAWASFLLGEVNNASTTYRASQPTGRYTNWGFFIDDSWKVTSKLTLNLGLRMEMFSTHSEPAGRLSYIDLNRPNAEAGNLPGELVFAGDQVPKRLLKPLLWNPAPRLGFAYKLDSKTVVRAAIGIFNGNYTNNSNGIPSTGFQTDVSFATGNNGINPAFNWDNGFPQNFQAPPNFSPYQLNGQNARAVIRDDYSIPYKTQWNLTIERQFGDDLGVSVAYVANKGTHLATTNRISEVPAQYRSLPENVLRANINSALAAQNGFGEPFPGFSDLWGSRATVAQSLRLYPQFGNLDLYGDNLGNSNYNSFQSKIDKRYKGGLSGTFAYTWSKNLDDLNFQSYNHRDYSYSDQDHTHVVSLSFLYQLPFGKGKKLLSGASGAIDKIVGGWQIGGVGFYSSGQRLAVTTNNTLPYFNASRRPDIISNDIRTNVSMSDFDPAKDRFLNPAAFSNPAPGQFGNSAPRLNVRGRPPSTSRSRS
ncbi:MAG: TonB-dependent receptor [Bryobacterales bacterium]